MANEDAGTPDDRVDPSSDATKRSIPVADALNQGVSVGRTHDERVPVWLDSAVQYTWRGLILLLGVAAVLFALTRLYLVALPIVLALILATLCVPPARGLEARGVPRLIAAFVVVIGGIGTVVGILAFLTPTFIEQGRQLQPSVADGVDSVLMWLEEGPVGYDRTELEALFNQALESLEGSAGTIATSVGTVAIAIGQGIAALTLAVVLLFFFVKDGEQIVGWFIRLVPDHHSDTIRAAGARGWVALSGFVRGTALVALIDALGIGIGLAVLGVPATLPLSVLIFFGGFIPVIGATVTGLLAVLVALASGGLTDALIVLGIVLIVQQLESNILQPTIMRRAVALHPVVILGVLTAGAVLIGIVGAFLAVPVAAVAAAIGNELRLRNEITKRGGVAGPSPIGGPGVDPTTVRVQFPADTQLRAAGRRRDAEGRTKRERRRTRVAVDPSEEHVAPTGGTGRIPASRPDAGPAATRPPEREIDTLLTTSDLRIPIQPRPRPESSPLDEGSVQDAGPLDGARQPPDGGDPIDEDTPKR